MQFFTWLQDTPFAHWVASDPSLLAYPTILTLHTVGMAIVVGTCLVLDLRLLGIAADVPLTALARAPRLVWTGFIINAATGIALFTTDAEHKATQTVFFVKLSLIRRASNPTGPISIRRNADRGRSDRSIRSDRSDRSKRSKRSNRSDRSDRSNRSGRASAGP
jgi:hypothetical protein